MKRSRSFLLGLLVVSTFGSAGLAEAGVIFPVTPATGLPDQSSLVTVSLFTQSGADVTDTWLPTWEPASGGPTIYVSFNSRGVPAIPTSVVLKPPPTTPVFNGTTNPFLALPPTTSAYPGRCTNFGSSTDLTADYTFSGTGTGVPIANTQRTGFALTSQDCGGMAVVEATFSGLEGTFTFVIPQDSNRNGIPDIWEARFCPSNSCPTGLEDVDAGPVAGSPTGDGIAAFDEYRGLIVSGAHVPTDPRQRDVFVHLVQGQCGSGSLLGGGPQTYPNDGTRLLDNLATLVPGTQLQLLGQDPANATEEWVDRFASFSQQTGFQYVDVNGALTTTPPVDDRRINKNAVFPRGIPNPVPGGGLIHKGLRLTECLDTSATAPLGTTGIGTPTGPDASLLYTQRIYNYINTLITNGGSRVLRVFAFESGAWVRKTKPDGTVDADFVISQAMKFYASHELTHSLKLTPTTEGTRQVSYGYHHAPGTGSVMDQTIVQKIDKSTSGFNSFYIPSQYNGSDASSYKTQ